MEAYEKLQGIRPPGCGVPWILVDGDRLSLPHMHGVLILRSGVAQNSC